ncbi:MAG TPA: methyltransferase domain-containing protein [Pyrinomonadaceae bacterium]|nr:methyltransferase domain-containing protein [Pyrinomonadaceae bacterium]
MERTDELKQRIKYLLKRKSMLRSMAGDSNVLAEFAEAVREMSSPRVLELGTKRLYDERTSMHRELVPNAGEFLGADISAGQDVDIVVDVHELADKLGDESFDVIISCSSFEHFKYPHLAAHQIMRTLRIGGAVFIQTHQAYPIHAAPYDYFRFSREAMNGLFGTKMGFDVIATDYEFPSRIYSKESAKTKFMPAFLNVRLFGIKTDATPDEFVYELDTE